MESFSPVAARERLGAVDAIRGAAVLGILVVNVPLFFSPIYREMLGSTAGAGAFDRFVGYGIDALAQGKFYTMFSMLFGLGMALQSERFRGDGFGSFWARRMLVLLAIGLAHAWLLWYGDILVWYALTGLVLLAFRRRTVPTITRWIAVLWVVPLAALSTLTLLTQTGVADAAIAQQQIDLREALDRAHAVYPGADLATTLRLNFEQWTTIAGTVLPWLPNVLGMFLVGVVLGRVRLFDDTETHIARIRRLLPALGGLALVTNVAFAWISAVVDPSVPSLLSAAASFCMLVGGISGSLTYLLLLLLAYRSGRWRRIVAPLAPVGRMALSNYVLHSAIFTTLANGYGGGLYGQVSATTGLALTLGVFAGQIVLSRLWLSRFRFGPLEWVWRSLTYGRLQPLRHA